MLLDLCFDHHRTQDNPRSFRGRSCFAVCPFGRFKYHIQTVNIMVINMFIGGVFYYVVVSNIFDAHPGLKPPTSFSATHRKPQSLAKGGLGETPSRSLDAEPGTGEVAVKKHPQ